MQRKKTLAYLGFSHFLGIGPGRFARIRQIFPSVALAYEAKVKELAQAVGDETAGKFDAFRRGFDSELEYKRLKKEGISILHQEDPRYPTMLTHIPDPPICLFAKGNLLLLSEKRLTLGLVGTRTPTSYGGGVTYMLAKELTRANVTIVSGLASGVDAIAHKASLAYGGGTIAVLGCGVDVIYPAENRTLYSSILAKNGLILSEFPRGQIVAKGLFISRNRIISGLSQGVIIVEGRKHSGALITARHAASQGRDVFAVPSQITSELSQAPHILLKQGAILVSGVQDILNQYSIQIKQEISAKLSESEQFILDAVADSLDLDELVQKTGLGAKEVLQHLTMLEIKGVLVKNSEDFYDILFKNSAP